MEIGQEIRRIRETAGLTLAEVADGFMTPAHLSLIERGKTNPSKKMIQYLAQRLGKPAYYFDAWASEDTPRASLLDKIDRFHASARANLMDEAKRLSAELDAEQSELWDTETKARHRAAMSHYSWRLGNLGDALFYARNAYEGFASLDYKSKMIEMLYSLGNLHARANSLKQAVDYLKQALNLDAEYRMGEPKIIYNARVTLAAVYTRLGMDDEAIKVYESLTDTRFNDYEDRILRLLNMARAYYNSGEIEKGKEFSATACKLAREFDDTENQAKAEVIMGLGYQKSGSLGLASDYFKRAYQKYQSIGNSEHQAATLVTLAETLLEKGEVAEAESLLAKALELDKGDERPAAIRVRALVANKTDRPNEAIIYLTQAAEKYALIERYGTATDCLKEAAQIAAEGGDAPQAYQLALYALQIQERQRLESPGQEKLTEFR